MKKLLSVLAFLAWASTAQAGLPVYYTTVSATESNTTVTISFGGSPSAAETVTIANDGPNEIYIDTSDDTATTSNLELKSGEVMVFKSPGGYGITTLGIICASGETATVRVFGFPTK